MANYFLDTSALIKRYAFEPGSPWVRSLYSSRPKHVLAIAQITIAESIATLCRKAREQTISMAERDKLIDLFFQHRPRIYATIQVTNAVCIQAGTLCRTNRL